MKTKRFLAVSKWDKEAQEYKPLGLHLLPDTGSTVRSLCGLDVLQTSREQYINVKRYVAAPADFADLRCDMCHVEERKRVFAMFGAGS